MNQDELIPNLFRTEYSKIVAVLTNTFGLSNIEMAQDITSDIFLKASEVWGLKGTPKNPKAWLYISAKNRALDYLKRSKIYKSKVLPSLQEKVSHDEISFDFSEKNFEDSQLSMIFAVCNPLIPNDAQVILALRILCGFGISEISNAMLSNKPAINKKLYRAKEKLRQLNIDFFSLSQSDILKRMPNVLYVLYLLFNEGYFSYCTDKKLRYDVCFEAMRLTLILLKNKNTNTAETNALMALFCFHASRFDARIDDSNNQILYADQDRSKWNFPLIQKGEYYIALSAKGNNLSKYHLESLIAFWHTRIESNETEKWNNILQLYNKLLQLKYSPSIALNRTFALAKVKGEKEALKEALKIGLNQNFLYHALLAELYKKIDISKQKEHLLTAIKLAKNPKDIFLLQKKLDKTISNFPY